MLATPLETATLPPGIRSRFVRGVNGLDIHILEAGYAPAGPPFGVVVDRVSETDYSRRQVMPALADRGAHAVAPRHRLEPRLRYRSAAVAHAQRRARRARPRRGVGAPFDPRRRRQRFRRRDRRVVCSGSARRVPLAGADDAVWRTARPAVRHRREGVSTARDADDPRGAGGAAQTAQALSVVLRDAAGQCPDHALPTGRAQFPARLLPPQERRLERQQAASARRLDRRRTGEDADLLYHGPV